MRERILYWMDLRGWHLLHPRFYRFWEWVVMPKWWGGRLGFWNWVKWVRRAD